MATSLSVIPSISPRAADLSSEERMATLKRLNSLAGYTAAQTILPEGTALWDVGEQNLLRHKADVNALPSMRDFAPIFLEAERIRDLRDVSANLADMRMNAQGYIFRTLPDGTTGKAIGYTHTGLSQLVSLYRDHLGIPNGMTASLEFLTPRVRAEAFNDLAIRADERMQTVRELPDRVFRTALNPYGERYLRAVTSAQHVGLAGGYSAMVRELAKIFPDAKVRAVRTEDRLDLEMIFTMYNREIRVGDVLQGTLGVTISETKDVAARVWDGLLRVLCANLTRQWYGADSAFTRRHVGAAFVRDMANRIKQGWDRLQPFVDAFGDAYTDELPGNFPTRAEAVARVLKAFPEVKPLLAATSVVAAWDLDGARSAGNTRAGLVNAFTRVSQTLSPDRAEVVESVTGRIIEKGWAALN